ncbi:MAG: hypothetical protein U9P68_09830 [Pseudomonadota bacterium]|nr:hypothetical protein [Pseudomonadota bacterium]
MSSIDKSGAERYVAKEPGMLRKILVLGPISIAFVLGLFFVMGALSSYEIGPNVLAGIIIVYGFIALVILFYLNLLLSK